MATRTGNPPATGRINMGSIGISREAEVMDLQMAERCDVSLQTATDCTGKQTY